MNILGIIPARGGSKGVKNKNILKLSGKPLIGYTIEDALKSKLINKVVVSTDSKKIANLVRKLYKVGVIMRPAEFAKDDSPIEEALLHAIEYLNEKEGYKTDLLVWMQPNVPIRKKGIIDNAIKKLKSNRADSCVTCYEADQIPEAMKVMKNGMLVPLIKDLEAVGRQDFPKRYLLDGSVLVLKPEHLLKNRGTKKAHTYLGSRIMPIVQDKRMHSLEIDVPEDLPLIEYYIDRFINKRGKK